MAHPQDPAAYAGAPGFPGEKRLDPPAPPPQYLPMGLSPLTTTQDLRAALPPTNFAPLAGYAPGSPWAADGGGG